jgi:hypothetical protein
MIATVAITNLKSHGRAYQSRVRVCLIVRMVQPSSYVVKHAP